MIGGWWVLVARASPVAACGDDRACVAAAVDRAWAAAGPAPVSTPPPPGPEPLSLAEQAFVDACDEALARFPGEPALPPCLARAGALEAARGRLAAARAHLERALALPDGPDTEPAGMLLVEVLHRSGDWEALGAAARALAARPVVGAAVRRDLADVEAQVAYHRADLRDPTDPATADAYLAVADGFPGSELAPLALRNAARVLERAGAAERALAVHRRLVALEPPPDPATGGADRMALAFTLERLGRDDEAAAWFEAAADRLERAPDRAREAQDALYDAALLRDRRGEADAALRLYRRYARTWPDGPDVERVRERIRALDAP